MSGWVVCVVESSSLVSSPLGVTVSDERQLPGGAGVRFASRGPVAENAVRALPAGGEARMRGSCVTSSGILRDGAGVIEASRTV